MKWKKHKSKKLLPAALKSEAKNHWSFWDKKHTYAMKQFIKKEYQKLFRYGWSNVRLRSYFLKQSQSLLVLKRQSAVQVKPVELTRWTKVGLCFQSLMYKKIIDSKVRNTLANELMMYHMKVWSLS